MKPVKELSPQLAARLGPVQSAPADTQAESRRGGSDYSKLRGIIRLQKDQIQALENEVAHFQSRQHRIEDGHRLELARLKKEVEYHKRLRQGADQRSYELEDRLARLQQHQQRQLQRHHEDVGRGGHADEEKDSLIAQSQVLVAKNSELASRVQQLESQVHQLEELKSALESEMCSVYQERDELAAELEHVLMIQHRQRRTAPEAEVEAEGDAGPEGEGDTEAEVEARAETEAAAEASLEGDTLVGRPPSETGAEPGGPGTG